jgi:hypothetical protein
MKNQYVGDINDYRKYDLLQILSSNKFCPMSYNVPAVYDVLAARIGKCEAFAGPTKCGWRLAWE